MTIRTAAMISTLVAFAALPPATSTAQDVVGRADATFTLQEAVRAGQWVRIASPNGTVRVTEGGERVEIQATKDARRGRIEDVGFVVRRESDGLVVCAVYESADECRPDGSLESNRRSRRNWDGGRVRVDFTVRVPAGLRLRAGSGNGDVSVTGGTEVEARSGNGQVDVSSAARQVRASSGNGRVTVQGAKGPVDASTGNGDVRVTTSLGPVTASSGNGDIDVDMEAISGSPDMTFSTGNGRVTVVVPANFGAQLETHTGHGSVSVDFPLTTQGTLTRSSIRGTLGKGGGRLVMRSGNGDLVVRRR
jgi:Putative adhesin